MERTEVQVFEMSANLHCHRFAVLLSLCTWILIWAGALVTSTESGLAVPDWPLSYGMLMPPMVGGIFYEHGHRMVATFVGLLTVIVALWLWRRESRPWVRRLGALAVVMVIAQGVLGGITVLYFLPAPVSVAHATLAQTFFCLTILLAFATSREWNERSAKPDSGRPPLRTVAAVATGAIYLQLILGAVVRHTGSALAIPDFPLAFGRLIPPFESPSVVIHFVHRFGAVVAALCIGRLAFRIWREHREDARLSRPGLVLFCLALAQIVLGGAIVWTSREVVVATAHVATGALILATAWLTTLRAHAHLNPPTPRSRRS